MNKYYIMDIGELESSIELIEKFNYQFHNDLDYEDFSIMCKAVSIIKK
jgi:hypothetical protein